MYRVERKRLHPFCTVPKCDRTRCYLFHVQQHRHSSSPSPSQLWQPRSSLRKDPSNEEAYCSSQSAPVNYSRGRNYDSSRRGTKNIAAKSTSNQRLLEANRQSTSTITLDDIIASARRKISDNYVEPPLPQNILTAVRNGKLPYTEHESTILNVTPKSTVNEVTRIEDILTEDSSFTRKLLDSDSDTFLSCEPPSLEADDDLDHIVRAVRPTDIYSNPIMYPADPLLSTSRKNHLMDREISLDFSEVDLSAPSRLTLTPQNDSIMSSPKRCEAEFLGSL